MYRRTVLGTTVAVVGALAGCVGESRDGGTPTTTVSGSVVAYGDLSTTEQAAFDAGLEGEVRFTNSLPESYGVAPQYDLAVRAVFERNDYVRKDGRLYEVTVDGPAMVGGAGVGVTEVDASEADVQFEDLDDGTADLVRRAIEGDGLAQAPGAEPPDLEYGDVVAYEGEYYEVSPRVVDYGYFTLEVEPA